MKSNKLEIIPFSEFKNCLPPKKEELSDDERNYPAGPFSEFLIDGKLLLQHIAERYWTDENNYFDFLNSGYVGRLAFFNRTEDEFFIKSLLKVDLTEQEIIQLIRKYSAVDLKEGTLIRIKNIRLAEQEEEVTLFYMCSCGDYYCGGIGFEVVKEDNHYYWVTADKEGKRSEFRFERIQYEACLSKYLEKNA